MGGFVAATVVRLKMDTGGWGLLVQSAVKPRASIDAQQTVCSVSLYE